VPQTGSGASAARHQFVTLADLTATEELVNPRDKRGYRLPEWRPDDTPSLFKND